MCSCLAKIVAFVNAIVQYRLQYKFGCDYNFSQT